MSSKFKPGDRVKSVYRGAYEDIFGTVTAEEDDKGVCTVSWDDFATQTTLARSLILLPPQPACVSSEMFRRNPQYREWHTSYTKQVCDKVGAICPSKPLRPEDIVALVDAIELLKNYHDAQHVGYEERDALKAKVERLVKLFKRLVKLVNERDDKIDKIDVVMVLHGT